MVAEGTFRDDLFYRINIFPIQVPPLRERRDDIPALAFHFLKVFSAELGKQVTEILRRRDERADEPRLAGQRARTREHHAPRGDPRHRQRHPPGAPGEHRRRRRRGSTSTCRRTSDELKRVKKAAREKSVEEHREAVRAGGAQAQRLERHPQRRGNRHAARQFPGADEEVRHPRPRTATNGRPATPRPGDERAVASRPRGSSATAVAGSRPRLPRSR